MAPAPWYQARAEICRGCAHMSPSTPQQLPPLVLWTENLERMETLQAHPEITAGLHPGQV